MANNNSFGRGRGLGMFTPMPAVARGRGLFLNTPEASTPKPNFVYLGERVNNAVDAPQCDVDSGLFE